MGFTYECLRISLVEKSTFLSSDPPAREKKPKKNPQQNRTKQQKQKQQYGNGGTIPINDTF